MKTLEAVSNSYEWAEQQMEKKKAELAKTVKVEFGELRKYGNFEMGYKFVQDYKIID